MARLEFSKKTKKAAWARSNGQCEACTKTIRPGDGPEYDHVKEEYWTGGNNSLENCQVLCIGCHKAKTRSQAPVIAKSRRIREVAINARPKKRGFRKPDGYKYNWSAGRYEKV